MEEAVKPILKSNIIEKCSHCFLEIIIPVKNSDGELFCCSGCKTVSSILKDSGLRDEYYHLKKNSAFFNDPVAAQENHEKFQYLDDEEFISEYTREEDGALNMDFYLEGIHCLACLWLIEKLPLLVDNILSAKLNINKSVVTITLKNKAGLSLAATKLAQLGYRPHPILKDSQAFQLRVKEDRKMLIKIGIAAAGTMNIMLYAVSVYAGASGLYAQYFSWISLAFTLPVALFSALPFYQSSYAALKNKSINIDVPIAFAIIVGLLSGTYNTIQGSSLNYFDSITMLIFLLLSSRYLLRIAQRKVLDTTHFSQFFSNGVIRVQDKITKEFNEIHHRYLKANDIIKVLEGETISADGVILEGLSTINTSTLTGESDPSPVQKGDEVFSGTINMDRPILIKVQTVGEKTRVGKILKKIESSRQNKAPIIRFADKTARYLVIFILGLAAISFTYFALAENLQVAINRSLALIIITCPCALGLATPLAFSRALAKGARKGMIIKSEEVLERLTKLKNIFLDKTGTITFGQYQVVNWIPHVDSISGTDYRKNDLASIVYSLEAKSKHPIAKSLREFILQSYPHSELLKVDQYYETLGKGVKGEIKDERYQIKGLESKKGMTSLILEKNGSKILTINLKDKLRPKSKGFIKQLKDRHFKPIILSGDRRENVREVAEKIGLTKEQFIAELNPESKNAILLKNPNSIMVGDGANDALALRNAEVGIAMHGSIDISLRAADIYLARPELESILEVIDLSKETMRTIYRNLSLSLMYNITGAILAIAGIITPLWAAIIMPLSSLTVIISTLYKTRTHKVQIKEGSYT